MVATYDRRMTPRSRLATAACLLCALLAAACASRPPGAAPTRSVVVLSFDGLPADTIGDGSMPTLERLAREGVHARWMRPSFPTLTFPNHYTLATGLRPDRHGIVHNTFRDPALGDFVSKRNGGEGRWYGGEPIWATMQRQGGTAAALAWVGGQDADDPRAPALMVRFDPKRTPAQQADQILAWLALPLAQRPRLVMAYFDRYDIVAHANGPGSPEAAATKAELDAALARIVDALRIGDGLTDDLVVLSDHGMREVPPAHVAVLDPGVPADAYEVVGGSLVGVFPKPGREAEAARLLGRREHHACHRRETLPARWAYGSHPRVPPIVCLPDPGWYLFARDSGRRHPRVRGEHGFDPEDPAMRAVFVAAGPSFRRGEVLPAFDNVDVYPLLARLLDVQPAPNDGSIDALRPALKDPGRD